MGKNIMGGGKTRKGARIRNCELTTQKNTRYAKEEGEIYACVTRLFGGSICEVKCIDGSLKQCIIRNKFRGRGKRDNTIISGTWVLVGERSWETPPVGKMPKCDLLEVYTSDDKMRLKKSEKKVNWSNLAGIGPDELPISDDDIDFHDEGDVKDNNANYFEFDEKSDSDEIDIDSI